MIHQNNIRKVTRRDVRNVFPLLSILSKLPQEERKIVLNFLDEKSSDVICECIHNGIRSKKINEVKREELKNVLQADKKFYRYLSRGKGSYQQNRKTLVKVANSIHIIFDAVIPLLVQVFKIK